jgi:glycosyltransferase involved in cell wall biosynthesis
MTIRLAIVSTHPIQYNAPAFRALAATPGLIVNVFYEWEGPTTLDTEFGRGIVWDVPLLDGYEYRFIANRSPDPGTHHFRGIDNPTLLDEIRAWKPDVMLVYGWSFASHVRVLRHFSGRVPIMFRGDSTLLDESPGPKKMLRRAALRWIYRHIDVALYTGTNNKAYFRALGIRDEQLVWAPHAVDLEHFAPSEQTQQKATALRSALGIDVDDCAFLFAGKLSYRKGVDVLVDIFCELPARDSWRRAHLLLAGDGELLKPLKMRAAGQPHVHFLGFQNQMAMPAIYRMCDMVIMPSKWGETWGLAVNESMALGRGAIVSDKVGCAPDVVLPLKTGIVFCHSERDSLRNALLQIIDQPHLAASMGIHAFAEIQKWSIPAFADIVSAVCRDLASSSRHL